jgi:hypothetical protein
MTKSIAKAMLKKKEDILRE